MLSGGRAASLAPSRWERTALKGLGKAVILVATLGVLSPACSGQGSGSARSSVPPEATVTASTTSSAASGSSTGAPGGRPTPTLVPFFQQLQTNGTQTVLNVASILPGATCTVTVTVANPSDSGKTLTFTAREDPQHLAPKRAGADGKLFWDTSQSQHAALAQAEAAKWIVDCTQVDRGYHKIEPFIYPPGSFSSTSTTASPTSTASRSPTSVPSRSPARP